MDEQRDKRRVGEDGPFQLELCVDRRDQAGDCEDEIGSRNPQRTELIAVIPIVWTLVGWGAIMVALGRRPGPARRLPLEQCKKECQDSDETGSVAPG
jgi:hypothetical protein